MRADAALADRRAAVRRSARSWQRAGVIDEASLAAIEKTFPDDRVRVGPVFRVLLFLFTLLAANALFGFVWLLFFDGGDLEELVFAAVAVVYGLALAALTEFQIGRLKRSQGGTEAATSFAALGYLLGGLGWFAFEAFEPSPRSAFLLLLVEATLILAAAAWRWGYALYAAAATAALLGVLAHLPFGRILWIVASILSSRFLLRLADSARLPPAHRDGCRAVLFVSLIGLYAAVHLGSFESGLVEEIGQRGSGPASRSDLVWWLAATATVIVPAVFLWIGIRTRRHLFLVLGLGTGVVSDITIVYYVGVEPVWAALTVSGIVVVAGVLALRRYLDSGPGRERAGFTAEPLFEDLARQRILEAAAAVAVLTPEARPVQEEPRYKGGGGEFGGGGSTTEF